MITERKTSFDPNSMSGRKIVCCFCSSDEEWKSEQIKALIKDYPDAETKIKDAITSKRFRLGKVIYAKGNSTSIIAILTVVKNNQVQYPYLYGALLDITLRAFQAKAFIVMTEPYMKLLNNQWSKIKPMLSRCIEITQKL